MTDEKPLYPHDCAECVFLGRLEHYSVTSGIYSNPKGLPSTCDLYVCLKNYPTVIARYSKRGEDYASGMRFGKDGSIPELGEAFVRAVRAGLITESGDPVSDTTTVA